MGAGDFVRIGYNEVSIGHPDAIAEVLKTQMNKVCLHKLRLDLAYINATV
jgi:hypothetical protein